MEAALKRKWLKALRSGEYLQTTKVLHDQDEKGNDRFCCLGVLVNEGFPDKWRTVKNGLYQGNPDISVWGPCGLSKNACEHLIEMNDGGKRFKTIANWIEKNI